MKHLLNSYPFQRGAVFFILLILSSPLTHSEERATARLLIENTFFLPYGKMEDFTLKEGAFLWDNSVELGLYQPLNSVSIFSKYRTLEYSREWENQDVTDFSTQYTCQQMGIRFLQQREKWYSEITLGVYPQLSHRLLLGYNWENFSLEAYWSRDIWEGEYHYELSEYDIDNTLGFQNVLTGLGLAAKRDNQKIALDFSWSNKFQSEDPWDYRFTFYSFNPSIDLSIAGFSFTGKYSYSALQGRLYHEVSDYVFLDHSSLQYILTDLNTRVSDKITLGFHFMKAWADMGEDSRLDTIPFVQGGSYYLMRFFPNSVGASLNAVTLDCLYQFQDFPLSLEMNYYVSDIALDTDYIYRIREGTQVSYTSVEVDQSMINTLHHGFLLQCSYISYNHRFALKLGQLVPISDLLEYRESSTSSSASSLSSSGNRRIWGGFFCNLSISF